MNKIFPLVGMIVATSFAYRASSQFSATTPAITSTTPVPSPTAPANRTTAPQVQEDRKSNEPAYKTVIRCLGDLDDLLDMVVDRNSFEAIKSRLLDRVHQQVVYASEHPNQGMTRLGRAAAKEMQNAVNRHSQAVIRASEVAPGVMEFFEKKVAAMLSGN